MSKVNWNRVCQLVRWLCGKCMMESAEYCTYHYVMILGEEMFNYPLDMQMRTCWLMFTMCHMWQRCSGRERERESTEGGISWGLPLTVSHLATSFRSVCWPSQGREKEKERSQGREEENERDHKGQYLPDLAITKFKQGCHLRLSFHRNYPFLIYFGNK